MHTNLKSLYTVLPCIAYNSTVCTLLREKTQRFLYRNGTKNLKHYKPVIRCKKCLDFLVQVLSFMNEVLL